MVETPVLRRKHRENTKSAILEAAKEVLAETGFGGFGVNSVARRANCDKQLIYRYFGGLDGLAAAIGTDLAEQLKSSLGNISQSDRPESYAELVRQMVGGMIRILEENPIMRQINAWEIAAPSLLVAAMSKARSQILLEWVGELRGDLQPPAGIDVAAQNAIMLAAAQQLAMSSSALGEFMAVPLRAEQDWVRIADAFSHFIETGYRNGDNRD